ncbi:MAG: LamG domain-containing protein, partial [Deltaproteobacteria bacterium]|nr:LamG domain-containing protein [Deltaproteobacteria bacterium]MBW2531072.1 LamG domain-containing protein [Deltaproteobacteria bacterium]
GISYADAVLADGPLAYWRLGEDTTPTAVDATGNGHDGLYVGGVTVSVPGAIAGDADTAVHFDGAAEVTVADVFGFEGNATFSVEAWIKPETSECSFIGKVWKEVDTYHGWLIYLQGTEMTVRRGYNLTGPHPPLDEWTHVVATYDGYTLRLYQDGQLSNDRQVSNALPTHSEPFTFGRTYQWVACQITMDEVAVYGTNLSPTRILAHYEIGAGLR